jgi:hypothetical protein
LAPIRMALEGGAGFRVGARNPFTAFDLETVAAPFTGTIPPPG